MSETNFLGIYWRSAWSIADVRSSAAVRDCPRRIAETNLRDKGPVRLSRAVNILDGFTEPVVLWAFLADTIVSRRPLISHTQTSLGRVPSF